MKFCHASYLIVVSCNENGVEFTFSIKEGNWIQ